MRTSRHPACRQTSPWLALPLIVLLLSSSTVTATAHHSAPSAPAPGHHSSAPTARHDIFHGLFGPPPSVDMLGLKHSAPRKGRTVDVPYFVQHLIPHHHQQQRHSPKRSSPHHSSQASHPTHPPLSSTVHTADPTAHHEHDHDHAPHNTENCRQSMQIENSLCDYDAVETINREMRKQLQTLVQQKYFKFYKLKLYGTCPFWTENHLCMNEDCGVAVMDESAIPEEWTSAALGAISSPSNGKLFQPYKSCQLKDQDFCQVDDEALSDGVYVDLVANPERFTGYSGPSAAKVWDAIYDENCFNIAHKMQEASHCEQCSLDREADEDQFGGKLKSAAAVGISLARNPLAVVDALDRPGQKKEIKNNVGSNMASSFSPLAESVNPLLAGAMQEEEVCLEKRVFYRMISGLHASISIHICDEYFNQTSGTWGPNLECFVSRVGAHPDRLENIYFDYAILVRAVTKLSGYLKNYEFCSGHPEEDARVKAMVDRLIETSTKSPAIFDEKAMFVGPGAQALKMEFRDHFRNITKIMDCVGCEKCRLWGKVQTSGLGTALKVLFSYNDEHLNPLKNPNILQRTEIVALFNTLNRLSESVESITMFREMYMEQQYGGFAPTESTVVTPEDKQEPVVPEPTATEADLLKAEAQTASSSTQPFYTSLPEDHLESVMDQQPLPTYSTHSSYLIDAKSYLDKTRQWIRAQRSVLTKLVLDVCYHPSVLFFGEQLGNAPSKIVSSSPRDDE